MTDKLVAITGSSGFLGSALCAHLLSESISVRPIVRQKIEVFSSEYAVGSIDSTTDWSGALSGVGCVIHCAARAHKLNDSSSDPLTEYRKTNYFGTLS
jgi:nucleoside-diphosphate-sugar epimerase